VGWSLDRTLRARLPLNALEQAIMNRQPLPGLIHHSDRGVQYACADYVRMLRNHQIIPSISRPGNPYDNATCESFLKTLKREEIYANDYRDLEQVLEGIGAFIEHYYNRTRLHSALGYRSPARFEIEAESENAQVNFVGAALKLPHRHQQRDIRHTTSDTLLPANSELVRSIQSTKMMCANPKLSQQGSP
jgi:hypothetical protein